MRKRLAGAREAGASEEEVLETLYLTMRASAAFVRQRAFTAMEEILGGVPSPDCGAACDCG